MSLPYAWMLKYRGAGTALCLAIGFTPLFLLLSQLGVVFNLDPPYFLVQLFFRNCKTTFNIIDLIILALRMVLIFVFTLNLDRTMCFMLLYCFQILQSNISALTVLQTLSKTEVVISEYRELVLINGLTKCFSNNAIALLMFLAHSCSLCMLWLSIRGWGLAPDIVICFFPISGLLIFIWVLLMLTAIGGIHRLSHILLHRLLKRVLYKERGISQKYFLRQVFALRPLCYRSGNWFVVTKKSPGNFLSTAVGNLVFLVITFR